ncbi:MAG: tRNA (adenosine(37)-N6)-threonylcarbamoyltransferase complex dimerization subunit type 1 TsaB, partial [Muribaculaceae bacterium]|nr:tRNA (adenosine(37)-N6)-threonylcarbamoyltransferase complex dimerization subunit type 1 TsaB [Muribaculaceae bacterium]
MTILNIETSTNVCSVAVTADGMVLCHREDFAGHNHATLLSGFIKDCLDHIAAHEMKLDAVAVSIGPGSYTGLRIGLSEAKGLCYALGIPLIGIDTLKIMAVEVMFTQSLEGDELFVPMIDARRMEVYTAVYDMALATLVEPTPLI